MEYPQRITPQGGPLYGDNVTNAGYGGTVVVPTSGCGDGGGGARRGIDICPSPEEHHEPVYCASSDTGSMSGGRMVVGRTGIMTVVGSGRH